MFCHKCGAQALEGSAFCPKCGTKLIIDDVSAAPATAVVPEINPAAKPTGSTTTETGEIYALLKEGLSSCPRIKAVSPAPKGSATIAKGTVYNYIASIVNGQIKLGRTLAGPFLIPLSFIGGFLAWLASWIGWDIMEGSFYFEDHAITLAVGLLAIGLFVAAVSFFGEKEANVVLPFIRKALEPRAIGTPTDEKRKRSYTITLLSGIACALAGIIILISFLFGDALSSNYEPVDTANSSPSPTASDVDAESIILNKTYTNEAEGFSFRYPDTWVESSALEEGVVAQVTYSGMLGTYAGVVVSKSYADSSLFDYTEIDFQEMLSTEMDEVNIIEIANIDFHGNPARKVIWGALNDNDEDIIIESYIFNRGDILYTIQCVAIQSSYDNHKQTFDAIMESYTIADTDGSEADLYRSVLDEYIGYMQGENRDFYKECRYALYDIDGNDISEMLVINNDGWDDYTTLYTYANGKTHQVGDFWPRNYLMLDGKGHIYVDGDDGILRHREGAAKPARGHRLLRAGALLLRARGRAARGALQGDAP